MAITFVRSAEGTSTSATVTPTFGTAPAAGNLVVLTFAADDYNATVSSGWTESAEMEQQTFHGAYLWWLISAGGAVPSYTIGSAVGSAWVLSEFSGVDAAPYDISEGQFQATSTGSYTTPNITPTTGERLLVAMIGGSNTTDLTGTTPSSILNSFSTANWIGNNTGGTKQWVAQFYRTVTGDGSTAFSTGCSWGISMQSKSGLIAAFKEDAGGPAPNFPTIPTSGAGRILSTLNTAGGATSTFPNLSSLTKNAGDLLVAIIVEYDGNSTNAEFSSWGGGFNEFVDQAGTATMGIGAAYKWSTGSETGTFTVTTADATATDRAMILLSIEGAHDSTPPEGGTMTTGTTAAADIASFNPSGWDVEDTLWIAVGASGETATTGSYDGITAAPTDYTDYFQTGISADAIGGVEGAVAFRQLAAASDNPGTFTVDLSNARNAALLIAVRPAPAGPSDQSVALTPASVAVTGRALARTAGGVSPALSPATVTVTAKAQGRTAAKSVALTPATVTVTPQAPARTAGGVSVALTKATVTVTALALARTAGGVSPALTKASVAVTGVALGVSLGAIADPPTLAVAMAGNVATLTWDDSPTADVATYDVFHRTPSTLAVFTPGTDTALVTGETSPYVHSGLASGSHDWQVFGVVAAWSPADLPGLLAAWDFSDTATITQSAGAVSAVSGAYGTSVGLAQGTGTKQPITGTRTINSLNVLDFDGSVDRLDSASFSTGSQPFTYAAVYQLDTGSGSQWVIDGLSGRAILAAGVPGGSFGLYAGAFAGTGVTADTNLRSHIATFNGGSSAYYIDRTLYSPGSPGGGSINAGVSVGNAVDNGAPTNGRLAEIVICSGTMGSSDRTALWDYWTSKWGTT